MEKFCEHSVPEKGEGGVDTRCDEATPYHDRGKYPQVQILNQIDEVDDDQERV